MRTVFSGADGTYSLPNLPVGPYQLKVVLQGFNTYVRDGIVLQVGSNPEINVTLAVGAISEQMTVTANTSLVETKNTGVGQVIDNQRIMEMPLNGRQATELIFLSGVAVVGAGRRPRTRTRISRPSPSLSPEDKPTASPTSWTAARTTIRSTA